MQFLSTRRGPLLSRHTPLLPQSPIPSLWPNRLLRATFHPGSGSMRISLLRNAAGNESQCELSFPEVFV